MTTVNRFWHGVSDAKLNEIETGLALEASTDPFKIPEIIDPNHPVFFCWDNNDIAEETLSGKGTTHCTTGIIIQKAFEENRHPFAEQPDNGVIHVILVQVDR